VHEAKPHATTRDGGQMHRGERLFIFGSSLSSEAKCTLRMRRLLESMVLQCSGGAIYVFAWSFALFVGESLRG